MNKHLQALAGTDGIRHPRLLKLVTRAHFQELEFT
jgi:hypothetical protein